MTNKIFTESLPVIFGLLICVVFIINPTHLTMAIFIFVAQPLFLYTIYNSVKKLYKDLKSKRII